MLLDNRVYGVAIGLVTDVDDPIGEARVKLSFPWLAEEIESGWAPIAKPMAGKDRGQFFMPEVGDEALVAFEHGSIDHPFVLGFLHNGVDLPPDDDIDNRVRRIKTVSGHILDFDDRPGAERIHLKTQGGHYLEMKDADGTIEIKTKGGQQILMSDQPEQIKLKTSSGTEVTLDGTPSTVTAKTAGGVSLKASDAGGVTVDSMTGEVKINCLSATVNASSSITVNAATMTLNAASVSVNSGIATFAGVVQCTTLIATSVVSSSYTPGAGNIW